MKKFLSLILTICTLFFASFGAVSCTKQTTYDYSANELIIEERDSFAPCYFNEFLHHNEHTTEYFGIILQSTTHANPFRVTINGQEWEPFQTYRDKLPEGLYDIVIETTSDCYLVEQTENGLVKVPCYKKITVPVFVSNLNEDKYAMILP
jgi:hypothetical protein